MEDSIQSDSRHDRAVGDTGKTIDELAAQFTAINRSQAVIEFDPHGRILWANDNFLRAMGYRSDQIVGQHHRMFMPRDDVGSSEYGEFWRQLGRGEFFTGRFRRVDGRGNELWLQASYNPIFDEHGHVIKVIKFAMDVTEDEMQKADATGQLQAISKVQAIIEFDLDGRILAAND